MDGNLLAIGKMAELNHVSIATLRLYDKKGLLRPRYVDPESGYRYYDIQQNARLDMIAYMKELGMSLTEIAEALNKADITLIEEILVKKNEQIHSQIRQLYSRHDAVERAIASFERYRKSPATGTISLEYIDRRYVWGISCRDNFYDKDIVSYEREVLRLRNALAETGLQQIHTYSIGTSIRKEVYIDGRFEADKIFIFLGKHDREMLTDVQMVDSSMYACIYLDDYDDEVGCAMRLFDWCREHKYHIAGDYICEVMTEFNVFDNRQRSMFLRLQVPVTFE